MLNKIILTRLRILPHFLISSPYNVLISIKRRENWIIATFVNTVEFWIKVYSTRSRRSPRGTLRYLLPC